MSKMPLDQSSPSALEITQHDIADVHDAMVCIDNLRPDTATADAASIFPIHEIETIDSVPVIVFKLRKCYCSTCNEARRNIENKPDQRIAAAPSRFIRKPRTQTNNLQPFTLAQPR